MMTSSALHAVRTLKVAADGLTLACAEAVGASPATLGAAAAPLLGAETPDAWREALRKLERRGRSR